MSWFDILTFEKLYLLKKGPIFVGSYATQNKLIQKTTCWHQFFRQKWAFPRLSTPVLHMCGHTNRHNPQITNYLTNKFNQFNEVISNLSMNKESRTIYQASFGIIHKILSGSTFWLRDHPYITKSHWIIGQFNHLL